MQHQDTDINKDVQLVCARCGQTGRWVCSSHLTEGWVPAYASQKPQLHWPPTFMTYFPLTCRSPNYRIIRWFKQPPPPPPLWSAPPGHFVPFLVTFPEIAESILGNGLPQRHCDVLTFFKIRPDFLFTHGLKRNNHFPTALKTLMETLIKSFIHSSFIHSF